jgi:hypothetical protein
MGIYVQLLERYLRLDPRAMADSLRQAGIAFVPDARPVFLGH